MGEAVDEAGMVRAHECEGLGRDISREDAESLAAALKERAVRELEEAISVGTTSSRRTRRQARQWSTTPKAPSAPTEQYEG